MPLDHRVQNFFHNMYSGRRRYCSPPAMDEEEKLMNGDDVPMTELVTQMDGDNDQTLPDAFKEEGDIDFRGITRVTKAKLVFYCNMIYNFHLNEYLLRRL